MQPAPSPSAGRGDVVLQPAYFTSVLYVQALRDDISTLTGLYQDKYSSRNPTVSPFAAFKQLWISQGWKWLHFRIFDDRTRECFLLVTMRLFLERIIDSDPVARVVGLFGAYMFYYTQPEDTAPELRRTNHIPIPIDHFRSLSGLSDTLVSTELAPLRELVLYIASTMVRDGVFYILPQSDLGPENPRHLPREILVDESSESPEHDLEAPKKKGRPSRRDKAKKARGALVGLNDWLDSSRSNVPSNDPVPQNNLTQYQADKTELIAAFENSGDRDAIMTANLMILERLREAQVMEAESGGEREVAGVERVERAVQELRAAGPTCGVLGLLGTNFHCYQQR